MSALLRAARGRRPRFVHVFLATATLLCIARVALPHALRRYALGVLNGLPEYRASIDDIDVNLWRGAYELEGVVLDKVYGGEPEPFLAVRLVDLSIGWLALARGELVGEAVLHEPVLQATLAREDREAETGEEQPWQRSLERLFPFRIDRIVARDGELQLKSLTTSPRVDVFMTDFYLEVQNLTNVRGGPGSRMAEAEAAGRPLGVGEFEARMRFDPLSDPLRFDLDVEVRAIPVVELNDLLQAYGKVDAEAGTFGLFAELAASDGQVEGYVKTLFEGLQLLRFGEIDDPADALELLWEGLVDLASEVFENQPHDRLATRVPLRGELGRTRTDLVEVVVSLLRNALIAALRPAIDDSVRLEGLEIVEQGEKP